MTKAKAISLPTIFTHVPSFSPLLTKKNPLNHKMPNPQPHSLFALLLLHFLLCSSIRGATSIPDPKSGELSKSVCAGKIGECAAAEEVMDSESNRRALQMRRRYISYDTLRRDMVPCDRPGASYYNCKAAGVANSYGRGCEIITRCARGD